MRRESSNKAYSLLLGIVLGFSASVMLIYPNQILKFVTNFTGNSNRTKNETNNVFSGVLYNSELADELYKKVRVLCWIMTNPGNHQTKAIHVRNTWGKRCNKLLFMSSKADAELGAIALPVNEGRENLWDKTKSAFQYVYQNHYNDADFFLKADDDSYVIVENMRYLLYQYRPKLALHFGHRYVSEENLDGYMAGGAYILSKKALYKFVVEKIPDEKICRYDEMGAEDLELGKCLQNSSILVDSRDDHKQKRFFPVGLDDHFKPYKHPGYWYDDSQYYNVSQGNLNCCSDTMVAIHYVTPQEMYLLEYLIYHVHPFGIEKSSTTTLPRKLSLKEILNASDADSDSVGFQKHQPVHYMEESEVFKRK